MVRWQRESASSQPGSMYLFEVKKLEESKGPWDYYKQLATIPAEEAWRPLDQGTASDPLDLVMSRTGRGVSCHGVPSRLTNGTMQGTSPRPSARAPLR
jgi:hypothetical protein